MNARVFALMESLRVEESVLIVIEAAPNAKRVQAIALNA